MNDENDPNFDTWLCFSETGSNDFCTLMGVIGYVHTNPDTISLGGEGRPCSALIGRNTENPPNHSQS